MRLNKGAAKVRAAKERRENLIQEIFISILTGLWDRKMVESNGVEQDE